MLIKINTLEYPVSESEFKDRFPNIAFPIQINYSDYGYAVVFPSPQPTYAYNQSIREIAPEFITDKSWYEQRWEVVNIADSMTTEAYQEFETNYINNLKSQKLTQVQEKKNQMRDAGFFVNEILFDSDMAARTAYLELAMQIQMNPAFTIKWKASNGVWVDMNASLFQSVMTAGKAHIEYCFAWQEAKEIEIKAATTADEVNMIDIT